MKKLLFSAAALLSCSAITYAQVGVNTETPKTSLDITGKPADATAPDGILVPRISRALLTAKTGYADGTAGTASAQNGALVFVDVLDGTATGKTVNVTATGFYFYDGTVGNNVWKAVGGGDPTKDAFIDDVAGTQVKLGTQSDGSTARPTGTEFAIKDNGNVLVGATVEGTVATAASGSSAAQQLARLTLSGGDAMINGITAGRGGGQVASSTVFGAGALASNTTGSNSTAFGNNALAANTSGIDNDAFGSNALFSNTTGFDNNAFGSGSLYSNTSGQLNNAFGVFALYSNIGGTQNNAFGFHALYFNTTGNGGAAFGEQALSANVSGNGNSSFGYQSILRNTTGSYNNALGFNSFSNNLGGNNNISLGYLSGSSQTSGDRNIYLGDGAGTIIGGGSLPATGAYGSDNIFIGTNSGVDGSTFVSGSNNIMIGRNQGFSSPSSSNQLNIAGVLFGTGLTGSVSAPAGHIGINKAAPGAALHVVKSGTDITPVIIEGLIVAEDNVSALSAGVPVNGLYRTSSGDLKVRY